jgi:hypothetical protein
MKATTTNKKLTTGRIIFLGIHLLSKSSKFMLLKLSGAATNQGTEHDGFGHLMMAATGIWYGPIP